MSAETQLSGPDLAQGVPLAEVPDGGQLLGHSGGEAVLVVRRGEEIFAVGATCTTWWVSAEAYQFTTRWDSSAPTRRMMLLMVAGTAVTTLASAMVAAPIAATPHSVTRLLSSFFCRFMFTMPFMSNQRAVLEKWCSDDWPGT